MHHTMRIVILASIFAVLLGCRTAPLAYYGGNGSSYEQAIVIKNAYHEEIGVPAEDVWLGQRYPGFDNL